MHRPMRRRAFTLVELLVVIAIIGVLVALLLPAIQAAREAARRRQCTNNVKQMALGFMNHESTLQHLPTGGWGFYWVGNPDGGYGKDQSGGWCYNILAYIEQQALRNSGKGISDPAQKEAALKSTITVVLPIFNCPSKRQLQAYPVKDRSGSGGPNYLAHNLQSCNVTNGCVVARNDYRVNAGNLSPNDDEGPPAGTTSWKSYVPFKADAFNTQSGISFRQSQIRIKNILDGTSNTAMIGEKCMDPAYYENGQNGGDDQCVFTGHDRDNVGYTRDDEGLAPRLDAAGVMGSDSDYRFGSAHVGGFNMAMCDGSVQTIGYEIDLTVWRLYGGRDDGR
jgi:prepilin-type N-terminal cleavage/methylation domain-containing protein/prepilin-type processing-associated H-X9-DG protein